jgi:hypothetical protein
MQIVLKNIERIQITGFFTESEAAFEFCRKHNYHITRSGPASTDTPHRYDVNSFLIIAEREAPPNPACSRPAKQRKTSNH